MSTQPEQSSEKEVNGLRLVKLMQKATIVLRAKFHQFFPTDPKQLYNKISKHKEKILKSVRKRIISYVQYMTLLPDDEETDSSTFDLTLLTYAMRVLCEIKAPITGWEDLPPPSDKTDGADLVRLRIGRNDLLHSNLKFEKKEYTFIWNRITPALERLGCKKEDLIAIKELPLDPKLDHDLEQAKHELKQTLQRVATMEDSLEGLSYNVYPPTPSFVGRDEELSVMHQALKKNEGNRLGMVIYGLAAVGKSELVRQYCQQDGTSHYQCNVIWINGENEFSMREDFINVAERIKLATTDEKDKPLSIKTIIHKVYRFFGDRHVLFVFDNVTNKSRLMDFIEPNSLPNVSILITSQLSEWSDRFMKMRIEVLKEEAALSFVNQQLKEDQQLKEKKYDLNNDNALRLCQKMQYLPLSLQQAISYIKASSVTVDEYLETFELHANILMKTGHGDEI